LLLFNELRDFGFKTTAARLLLSKLLLVLLSLLSEAAGQDISM
jgi:hypothetical protein